jgi:hypothetical protein
MVTAMNPQFVNVLARVPSCAGRWLRAPSVRLVAPLLGAPPRLLLLVILALPLPSHALVIGFHEVSSTSAANQVNVNPTARATFGQYRNTQEFIYLRENH